MKKLLKRLLSNQDAEKTGQAAPGETEVEAETEDNGSSDMTITLKKSELYEQELFTGIDQAALLPFLQECTVQVFKDGATLLQHNVKNRVIYLILSGKCKVCLPPDLSDAVASLGPGESVGEISFIDKQHTIASVITEGTVRALCIPEKVCDEMMQTQPDISLNMLKILTRRLRNNNALLTAARGISALHHQNAQIDPLTSLHNRRWLDIMLPRLMQRHNSDHKPLSMLMIDIDHFKKFNDTHGHLAGDEALRKVAELMVTKLRPEDIVTRYGGEEMLAVLPNTDGAGGWPVAERLRKAISETPIVLPGQDQTASVTVSIGLSTMSPGQNAKRFITATDSALYQAKDTGRNQTHWLR